MTALAYLQSIKAAEIRLQMKMQQMQDLKERVLNISVSIDQEVVSHTKNVGVMADTIAMIVDMQKEIDQQASEYVIAKREALRLLERLPPASATILIKRFFEGQTVLEIGEALFITKRQAQRRIERAMTEFQQVLDESEKTTE